MSWLEKIMPSIGANKKKNIPEGLWTKCPSCESVLYKEELGLQKFVCPKCDYHMRISAKERIKLLLDENNQEEIGANLTAIDILDFKDQKKYKDRITQAQKNTGENDAIIVKKGKLNDLDVVVCAFEFKFMGGSMGSVVGEKIMLATKRCIKDNIALIIVAASGGARMQEGLFSLMQMSKTSLAIKMLNDKQIPFISVLTDPTLGGVSASFATLGDIIIAEPKALIGFAGPRVIKQTIRKELPKDFQRSEFLLTKGAIDMVVHRHKLKQTIYRTLSILFYD